jgi:hypothetical protein
MVMVQNMAERAEEDRKSLAHDRENAEMTRNAVSAELANIRHSQTDVHRRLDNIEPVTDLVTSVRSKITGGLMLLGVLGGVAWAGILFFKEIIVEWFR